MMHQKVNKESQRSNIGEEIHKVSEANGSDEGDEEVQSQTLYEDPENGDEENNEKGADNIEEKTEIEREENENAEVPHKIESPKYCVGVEKLLVDVIKDNRVIANGIPIEYVTPNVVDGEVEIQ